MEINELLVHKAIIVKPQLLETQLGIKLEAESMKHHYLLSDKGEHIDFVFRDISGTTYLAEVKLRVPPISVIPQLYDHEYKKFMEINPELDPRKVIPVIVIDDESMTSEDVDILSRMNIKLSTYTIREIEDALKEEHKDGALITFEFPELEGVEDFLKKAKLLRETFGDINILLEGFRGESWWDGYYDFRTFWLWKEGKYPDFKQEVFQLLCEGRKEDCIWFTFLTAISDNHRVARYMILDENWIWAEILAAKNEKGKWDRFEKCLSNSGKWGIQALLDYDKRKQVIRDYLAKVGDIQEKYFLDLMSKSNNPFDAYNQVWKSIHDIHNLGNVVAGEFATYLSQWRILPIIPSDLVRESKFVKKALDGLGIVQPMESYRDAMLRLAGKYSVAPIVIERAMHKLGRIGREE